jgi:hypothetical protein
MDLNEFLSEADKENNLWYDLIKPTSVNLILGRKGMGTSALGYFLLENIGRHYDLLPIVVNFPREKQNLLPDNFVISSFDHAIGVENSIMLIDEGTTMIPAGQTKLENTVKAFQALSWQHNQIIIFVCHTSVDVGSRTLRGIHTTLLKEPSSRQIQHGSNGSWWYELLLEAKGKFKTIGDMGEDKRKYTYIDCDDPEFHALLSNPVCSFWTGELSHAWAGIQIENKEQQQQILEFKEGTIETVEQLRQRFKEQGLQDPYWHNVNELQAMCREKGLSISGNKNDLVLRLFGLN